jgi:putative tricarboxylic transport membrane protein
MNTMISFSNDWTVFFTRPISGTIVALTIIVLLLPFAQRLIRGRLVTAQTEVR